MTSSTQTPLTIDESHIQRLVDGELPDKERAEVLAAIDRQPERWRDVALAFVEVQLLDRELSAWSVTDEQAVNPPVTRSTDGPPQMARFNSRNFANVGVLMLAAVSLAVAAFFAKPPAQRMPNVMGQTVDTTTNLADDNTGVAVSSNPVPRESAVMPAYQLRLVNHDGQPIHLPVLAEEGLEQVLIDLRQDEPPMMNSLKQHGYQLETATRLVAHELANGERLIVPIQEFAVNYHGQ